MGLPFDRKLIGSLVNHTIQRFIYFSERWLFSTTINIWNVIFIVWYGSGLFGLSLSV